MRSAADVWPRAVLIYLIYRKASIGRRSVMWHIGSRLIGKYVKLTSARAVRLFACAARRGTKVRLRNGKPPQLRSSKFLRQTYKKTDIAMRRAMPIRVADFPFVCRYGACACIGRIPNLTKRGD